MADSQLVQGDVGAVSSASGKRRITDPRGKRGGQQRFEKGGGPCVPSSGGRRQEGRILRSQAWVEKLVPKKRPLKSNGPPKSNTPGGKILATKQKATPSQGENKGEQGGEIPKAIQNASVFG